MPKNPYAQRAAMAAAVLAAACATAIHAENYTVTAAAAGLTAIAVDGKCDLTEAIASMMQGSPINSDCAAQSASTRQVILSGANTVFQIAANTTVWSDMTLTTSDAGVVVEAAGTPLRVLDGCLLTLTGPAGGMTVRVKSGSQGRALWNGGDVIGTKITFQGGDVSGISGDANGGVIYNQGILDLTDGAIQNGKAVDGGGVYAVTPWCTLLRVNVQNNTATRNGGGLCVAAPGDSIGASRCPIQNNTATQRGGGAYNNGQLKLVDCAVTGNKAGQGGGIFHKPPASAGQPELMVESSTISGNKALASELTPVPPAGGGSIAGTDNACAQTETPSQAFDGDFGTKWCTSAPFAPSADRPAVLTYLYPSPVVVSAYSITSANDVPARDPKNWMLQGYNGSSWVTLHSIANWSFTASVSNQRYLTESFNSDANSGTQQYFNNTTAYSGYRLVITANNGNSLFTQLAEVQFFPQGQTGDGGGLYTIGHMGDFTNVTVSGNIAGCTNASCACTAAWCASTSNTTAALGKGGGVYAGNPPPEALLHFVTVAGNSASQGGGVYADHFEHWAWDWSLIGKNASRATHNPEPDFHGTPHTGVFDWHEDLVQNTAGTTGLSIGSNMDVTGDPLLNALSDNGGDFPDIHPQTHALQAGSPAKDRAISASGETKDERGVARPQGAYKDLGAFELQ